ncbi:MAG: UDP-N-acetylmuramoyl-L-alanine--D-glutamate ligase [Actinomycetaceae bacterium]|nr:UDP-N-acetylmuramoyl-L-alanine--D-glutamate ligase [Actinomycetaceae bacterium]
MSKKIIQAQLFKDKRVAVVGLGKSGLAVIETLAKHTQAIVGAFDAHEEALESVCASCVVVKESAEGDTLLAQQVMEFDPDIIVAAPGISEHAPLYALARGKGVEIISEIELAWRLRACDSKDKCAPWICITGTNGKTTVTSLTALILKEAGLTNEPIGNIGTPAITEITRTDDKAAQAFVLELSSFQLASTRSVSPWASVCLNFDDDHLEWHGNQQQYWNAKAKVYEHVQHACIYPTGNSVVQEMVDCADVVEGARAVGVTVGVPSVGEIGVIEDLIIDRAFGENRFREAVEICQLSDLSHLYAGDEIPYHVLYNVLVACSLARSLQIDPSIIRRAISKFSLGHHRIEHIDTVNEIHFVDDSKATNAHAALASVRSFRDRSVVWIVGGLAKGARFEKLVHECVYKLKSVVVIGTEQDVWKDAFKGHDVPVTYISSQHDNVMDEAVSCAYNSADSGDVVLLAPACASMDQFVSYADRGDKFAQAVRGLHE